MLKVDIRSFSYTENEILKDIRFNLNTGDHLAILGESGCGKSTLLHIIYGLLHLDEGSLSWKETPMLGPNHNLVPGEPFIKLVAQEFNVMPFTTVSENVAEHLSRLDAKGDEIRVRELLDVVDLTDYSDIMVKNLSGGQKQRVALAKALAKQPELLLLDEPFSNIDTFRKNKLRRRLYAYLKRNHISCITATHDSEEALAFSDQLLILKDGTEIAYGTPQTIYKGFTSEYIAGFFGEISFYEGKPMLPHQLQISGKKTNLRVRVDQSFFKGDHYLIQGSTGDQMFFFKNPEPIKEGTQVHLEAFEK